MNTRIGILLSLCMSLFFLCSLPACKQIASKGAKALSGTGARSAAKGSSTLRKGTTLSSTAGWLLRKVAEEAVIEVTLNELKQVFNNMGDDQGSINVQISNDYSSQVDMSLTYDGYNWYSYQLYPGEYLQESSGYNGIIGVKTSQGYYIVSQSFRYNASVFYY